MLDGDLNLREKGLFPCDIKAGISRIRGGMMVQVEETSCVKVLRQGRVGCLSETKQSSMATVQGSERSVSGGQQRPGRARP